jgi:hypothetical protein
MNSNQFNKSIEEALDSIKTRIFSKNQEYAQVSDVFSNFKTGISLQDTPQAVAWEYMTKHMQWLKDNIKNNQNPTDSQIDEKIIDIINYLLIIRGMYQEKNSTEENNLP